jgi:hypothetical protein
VDRLFKVGTPMHLLEQLMGGVIGVERLVAYKLSLQNQDRPLTAEQVFSGSKTEVLKKWSNPLDIKSSLLSITCDNVFDTVVKSNTAGESFPKDFANNFMDFLEILPREVAYTLLKRLLKAELKNFKAFISDKAYEARLTAIAKAAKGIA